MSRESGLTLVELLLAVTLMAVMIIPVTGMVYYMLSTHQDVVTQNELQHQGRLIMEYMSTKLWEGAVWEETQDKLVMMEDGQMVTLLWFDENHQRILLGEEGAYVASQDVSHFEVTPQPIGPEERLLEIELELVHRHTADRFKMRHTMVERRTHFDYSSQSE